MKVILNINDDGNGTCIVTRESGDPKFRDGSWGSGESRLLYHAKQILNKGGYDFIKKRMWRDGHLVSTEQLYLREKKVYGKRQLAIWNQSWQIAGANKDFNEEGKVILTVTNLAED